MSINMFKLLSCIFLVASADLLTFVSGQDEAAPVEVIEKDKLGLTIPNPFGSTPLFETNNQNGRLIGLHIPFIYEVLIHFRDGGIMNLKFSTKILAGMLSIDYDRLKMEDGQRHGPIKLSIFGFDLYNNHEEPYV